MLLIATFIGVCDLGLVVLQLHHVSFLELEAHHGDVVGLLGVGPRVPVGRYQVAPVPQVAVYAMLHLYIRTGSSGILTSSGSRCPARSNSSWL